MGRLPKDQSYRLGLHRDTLTSLGQHLQMARKRRRISLRDMAKRMMVSPTTLFKLEHGDPGVSLGVLVQALWVHGLHRRLEKIISPETDLQGLVEERKNLPKRIRKSKARQSVADKYDF